MAMRAVNSPAADSLPGFPRPLQRLQYRGRRFRTAGEQDPPAAAPFSARESLERRKSWRHRAARLVSDQRVLAGLHRQPFQWRFAPGINSGCRIRRPSLLFHRDSKISTGRIFPLPQRVECTERGYSPPLVTFASPVALRRVRNPHSFRKGTAQPPACREIHPSVRLAPDGNTSAGSIRSCTIQQPCPAPALSQLPRPIPLRSIPSRFTPLPPYSSLA